jgi:hypothetical protein
MATWKPILIGCPQHRKLVRGRYECDEEGSYRLGADGAFVLARARCDQEGGRCMQTLCVLHRYNRRGGGSWYPAQILAMPRGPRRKRRTSRTPPAADGHSQATDLLC